MNKLRRLSILLVWLIEVIFLPLCQLPWYLIIKSHGWPERSILDILLSDEIVVVKTIAATVLMSNLPDYFSIAIYASMIWHQIDIRKTVQPSAVRPTNNELEDNGEKEFGGIWVGESSPSFPSSEISLSIIERNSTLSPPPPPPPSPLDYYFQAPPIAPPEDNDNGSDLQCYHKWQCVMPVLRWHVALSLFDLAATTVNVLYCQGELGKMVTYLVQMFCCYWIPLVMITKNYRQLGSIWQYLRSKLC